MRILNDISTRFYDETEAEDILSAFDNVCEALDIHPERWAQKFFLLQTFNNIELNMYKKKQYFVINCFSYKTKEATKCYKILILTLHLKRFFVFP